MNSESYNEAQGHYIRGIRMKKVGFQKGPLNSKKRWWQ